ncbi:MAG: class I SAM-dependent methyltransferase [Candidatus Dormibacterales bacterium]
MSAGTRLKSVMLSMSYKVYLRLFGRGAPLFEVSERIVEYPFALETALLLPKGSRVAVFGCHSDLLTTLLPAVGFETHGVDVKDFNLAYEGFTFHKGDIRKIPLSNDFFDAVIAVSTIEHIGLFDNDDMGDRKAVGEMRRVLKPGGLFAITIPFAAHSDLIPMFERIYDQRSLARLLEGLDVESICAYAAGPGELWHPIAIDHAPEPQRQTSCTALVRARKPTGAVPASS